MRTQTLKLSQILKQCLHKSFNKQLQTLGGKWKNRSLSKETQDKMKKCQMVILELKNTVIEKKANYYKMSSKAKWE